MTNIGSIIVAGGVLNRKLITVNDMSVDRKLSQRSCPRYHRGGVAKNITFENGVPCFVSDHRFLWSGYEFGRH